MADRAKPGSIRANLRDSASTCWQLNEQLEVILPYPARKLTGSGFHKTKASAAPLPWYTGAAFLVLGLHAEVRDMEARLKMCANQPVRPRGGSSENTRLALESVVAMCWAVDEGRVLECLKWLDSWCGQARVALGDLDRPQRLPRQPGEPEPSCPWCQKTTLRSWPLYGVVKCINPECRDENGQKARAVLEFSKFTSQFELVWQTGLVGLQPAAA